MEASRTVVDASWAAERVVRTRDIPVGYVGLGAVCGDVSLRSLYLR